jgi:octaprenyl-diphosphate synthase
VVNEVVQFVKDMGGIDFAISQMQEFKSSAMKILYSFPESPSRNSLRDLVEYTVERNK